MKKKNDQLKKKSLENFLIWNKYILQKDIQKAFSLSKKDSHYVLTKIMKSFWQNEFNLFAIPWLYSEFFKDGNKFDCKINGKKSLDPNIITREALRFLIMPYIKNKPK